MKLNYTKGNENVYISSYTPAIRQESSVKQ
jgi:hypothetical protein